MSIARLNIDVFRMIKPPGCVDDYQAGMACQFSRNSKVVAGQEFLSELLTLIDPKELSIGELAAITGRDRSTIAKRLNTQIKYKTVSKSPRKMPGISRQVFFYTTVKAA